MLTDFATFFCFIVVLMSADAVAWSLLEVLMAYLTDVWGLTLAHAAYIINIFRGALIMMPIGLSLLADAFTGHYCMLLISSILNLFGMSLLALSTPPVLSKVTGNCGEYKPECIGNTQKSLFCTSLPFLAVGIAGKLTSSFMFMKLKIAENQTNEISDDDLLKMVCKLMWAAIIVLVSAIGGLAILFIKPWSLRFGISAIYTVVPTILFLSGTANYRHDIPPGSPFTTFFRVLVASSSKMSYPLPNNAKDLYEKNDDLVLPHTDRIRCLDKAAIVVPNRSREQQEREKWKLCRVTEVEEAKISVFTLPLWLNFALCGIVCSIGATYFIEQANQMDPYLGKLRIPLPLLPLFHDSVKALFANIFKQARTKLHEKGRGKYAPPIGILVAILCSILCCITAAAVERRRLNVVRSHGLLNQPKEKIPMSMFWLLPQFFLLGALNGISCESVVCFFTDQVPQSLENNLVDIIWSVTGAGVICSTLSVYTVSKISRPSWFQDTLNQSRLENYYWTLAVFSSINLVSFMLAAISFPYKESVGAYTEVPELVHV